jgi:hypothetical protein
MPTRDKDEGPAVEQSQTGRVAVDSAVSEHRRKIIKASAAAIPAIMTLRSGAAAAVASTYSCTARDNRAALNEMTAPDYVLEGNLAGNHDQWLRVRGKKVTKIERPAGTEKVIYCVKTGDGGPGNPALDWQCFNEDGTEYTGITAGDLNSANAEDVSLLVYLHFDEYGDDTGEPALYYPIIQTAQQAPPGYSPLTGSCLASIHPNLDLLGPNNLG